MATDPKRIQALFLKAVELPTADRAAVLDRECGEDIELRRRIEALLHAHDEPGSYLDRSAVDSGATADERPHELDAASAPTGCWNAEATSVSEGPGTRIGPYKLLQQIGEGGMGVVYMAEQEHPVRRRVALKIIKPGMDSATIIRRFEAERQALALMDHTHIAKVLDAGTTAAGRPFFVMELVKGVPITRYCDEVHLPLRERLELFVPVCQAIQHAHQKGIIHRDLKPSNVLVCIQDGKAVPKVIDFGVAKALHQKLAEHTLLTAFGQVMGTLQYMSPEQAELSALDIDTRADIYALGVLLYELLTGSTPLDRRRLKQAPLTEALRLIREEEPAKPSTRLTQLKEVLASLAAQRRTEPAQLMKQVRGELDWIVMKCLEKDRTRRYETANGLARDVQRYLADEPVEACPPSATYKLRKFARKNRKLLGTGAAFLFLLLLAGTVTTGQAVRLAQAEREQAERARQEARHQLKRAQDLDEALNQARALREQARVAVAGDLGKWAEARAMALRAEALLEGGPDKPELAEQVRTLLRELDEEETDRRMVATLEEIRLRQTEVDPKENRFALELALPEYAAAFRSYGLTAGETDPAGAAAQVRRRPEAIRDALVAALDDWLRIAGFRKAKEQEWLSRVLETADPDAWRTQMRRARAAKDRAALEKLAREVDVARQPPTTLVHLGSTLGQLGAHEEAVQLLRRAWERYPGDFWINQTLGHQLTAGKTKHWDQACRFHAAAVALRPNSPGALINLGNAVGNTSEKGAEVALYRRAIELRPDYVGAHYNLGLALRRKGALDEAIAAYKEAIRLKPDLAMAHGALGNALRAKGALDEAITAFKEAIRLKPDDARAHSNLGEAFRAKGALDEAIAVEKEAIRLQPDYYQAHTNLGSALAQKGAVDEAIAAFKEAIRLKPDYVTAHTNLGNALRTKGALNEAIAACKEAIRLKADYPQAHHSLGLALRAKGAVDEAIAAYKEAIRLKPDYATAHYNLGNAFRAKGAVDEAIAAYKEAIRLKPDYVTAYSNLGNALRTKGALDEAIAAYKEAIRLKPDHATAHHGWAAALQQKGALDAAILAYKEAIRLKPSVAEAHLGLGMALQRKGSLDDALAAYQEAIRLKPDLALAHYGLGTTFQRKGALDEAIAAYKEAIRLKPDDAQAHNSYAWLLITCPEGTLRNPSQAVELANRAVELAPTAGNYWNTLGAAYYRTGNWQAAVTALEKSMALRQGGSASDWFFLAMAHWQLDHKEHARQWYDRAVQWLEKHPSQDQELNRFRTEASALLGIEHPAGPKSQAVPLSRDQPEL